MSDNNGKPEKSVRLGEWLRGWRKAAGWTQTQFAKRMNATQATVSRWEKDENLPDVETLSTIVEMFRAAGVNPSPPPTSIGAPATIGSLVIGTIDAKGRVRYLPTPEPGARLPDDLPPGPIAGYRVTEEGLGALGRGFFLAATDRRAGVPEQAVNQLAIIHSLQHGTYLGFLRPAKSSGRVAGYMLERMGGAGPLFVDDVAWAERVLIIRPE